MGASLEKNQAIALRVLEIYIAALYTKNAPHHRRICCRHLHLSSRAEKYENQFIEIYGINTNAF